MIAISNRQRARKINLRLLKTIAAVALENLKIERAELGVVLVGAKEMALLNEKFLGHEGPTDVITFDYRDSALEIGSVKSQLHGEIFVCVEEAGRQAKKFRTNWRSELVRYIVHGVLHLTGQDDLKPAARKKMKRVEGRMTREISRCFALSKL